MPVLRSQNTKTNSVPEISAHFNIGLTGLFELNLWANMKRATGRTVDSTTAGMTLRNSDYKVAVEKLPNEVAML